LRRCSRSRSAGNSRAFSNGSTACTATPGSACKRSKPAGSTGINLTLLLRAITKVLGWRLRGRAWPNPFFHLKTRDPIYPLTVLSQDERDALRPYCGPQPTVRATA